MMAVGRDWVAVGEDWEGNDGRKLGWKLWQWEEIG